MNTTGYLTYFKIKIDWLLLNLCQLLKLETVLASLLFSNTSFILKFQYTAVPINVLSSALFVLFFLNTDFSADIRLHEVEQRGPPEPQEAPPSCAC